MIGNEMAVMYSDWLINVRMTLFVMVHKTRHYYKAQSITKVRIGHADFYIEVALLVVLAAMKSR